MVTMSFTWTLKVEGCSYGWSSDFLPVFGDKLINPNSVGRVKPGSSYVKLSAKKKMSAKIGGFLFGWISCRSFTHKDRKIHGKLRFAGSWNAIFANRKESLAIWIMKDTHDRMTPWALSRVLKMPVKPIYFNISGHLFRGIYTPENQRLDTQKLVVCGVPAVSFRGL